MTTKKEEKINWLMVLTPFLILILYLVGNSFIEKEMGFGYDDIFLSSFTITDMNFKYSCEEEGYLLDSKTCIIGDEDNATYDYFITCKGYTEHKFTNLEIEIEYSAKVKKYCTYGRVQVNGSIRAGEKE